MPTLDATTTAIFASTGLVPSTIYSTFVGLVGSGVAFGLWLVQVGWPFLLTIAFIYFMWRIARSYTHIGR